MRRHGLRSPSEFDRVIRHGRRLSDGLLVVHVLEGEGAASRMGLVVPARIGRAVARNRVKRRLRAIWNALDEDLRAGFECVIVARPGSAESSFQNLEQTLRRVLTAAGVIGKGGSARGGTVKT